MGISRFGSIQFALIVRRQLLESFTVGVGIHGLREAPRAGDLLEQKLLTPGHGVILIRCSVPQTNTRRGDLLQERQFEGLQPANCSGPPAVGVLRSPTRSAGSPADVQPWLDGTLLSFAASKGLIDRSSILGWLAHPSKSGGSQVSVYFGERKAEELKERDPVRHRADALVAAAAAMRDRIEAVSPD
ncbi:hypothetical protein [Bradyrhizobium sp. OHSU_III]|uniref:hypothetical protein n=1 Tax=Bradyrhizobium sp. OHSU_III TaxID=1297865 RepID=UPI001268C834|nr:hypothetical protein [Bradyrhizobium sp. OHSU_III]